MNTDPANKPTDGRDWLIAGLLAVIVLNSELLLALRWSSLGLFDSHNVIFDGDPNYWIDWLAHIWTAYDFWIDVNHPFLRYFVALPAHSISTLAQLLGYAGDPIQLREALTLLVSPLCAALKTVCLYFLFRLLTMPRIEATLLSALGALAFSSVVFGAVPESYSVTSFSMALLALLAVSAARSHGRATALMSVMAGVLSIGTTISNVIHYGWMNWAGKVGGGQTPIRQLFRSVLFSGVLLGSVLLIALALRAVNGPEFSDDYVAGYGRVFGDFSTEKSQAADNLLRFPELFVRTYLPTVPGFISNVWAIKSQHDIQLELSYNGMAVTALGSLAGAVAILLLVFGVIIAWREGGIRRWLTLGSAGSLLCFAILYSLFGVNSYLYSQHWLVSGLIIASAWLRLPIMQTVAARALLTAGLIAIAIGDLRVLGVINQTLPS